MRHILLVNQLKDLAVKKDSSLMMAQTLKEQGFETYLLFEEDFHIYNHGANVLRVFDFSGSFKKNSFYLETFVPENPKSITLEKGDVLHMRIDPPFDKKYLSYLWMLKSLQKTGIRVINDPVGIMAHNEKLYSYESKNSLPSYVGMSGDHLKDFAKDLKKDGYTHFIFKPLELFQGIGVEKVSLDNKSLKEIFENATEVFKGPMVAQPFLEDIKDGEIRSIYYKGKELGTILKTPPEGEFLANIAQGASYKQVELSPLQKSICEDVCKEIGPKGVDFIAFDILGDYLQEVNITCPGLLVEVSEAVGKNLALEMINLADL
jgi:glutathione synthase